MKQYFKTKGFRSGNITIPELQLDIQLEDHQFFKKEEEIEDIYDRLTEIRKEFGLDALNINYKCVELKLGVLNEYCEKIKSNEFFQKIFYF